MRCTANVHKYMQDAFLLSAPASLDISSCSELVLLLVLVLVLVLPPAGSLKRRGLVMQTS